MRPRTWLILSALAVLLIAGIVATASGDVTAASGPLPSRRASIPLVSADSGTPLVVCNPSSPDEGFSVARAQYAFVTGFDGTIYEGVIISHCTVVVGDVSLVALVFDKEGKILVRSAFHPNFSVIQPGQGSPFIIPLPGIVQSSIGTVTVVAGHFTPLTGPVPNLELQRGAPTALDNGISIPYVVRNTGGATAPLPRIAGRILGSACLTPFVIDFLLPNGAPLPPGASASGSLFIPGTTCTGAPDLAVGSLAPNKAGLPAGLSFAAVRTLYTPDGVLHLIANVCNGSSQEFFLPQFRVQFKGSATTTLTLSGSGIYSGNSCAPLLATAAGAPAGLTFDKLVSPATQTATQSVDLPARLDPEESELDRRTRRMDEDCTGDELKALFLHKTRVSDKCHAAIFDFTPGPGVDLHPPPRAGRPQTAEQIAETPSVVSFAYNGGNAPLAAAAYRIQALGYGRDGSLVAGVEVSNPPALPAHGWGVSVTPLAADSLVALAEDEFSIDGAGFAIPK